jgi:hypothetical protein
MTMPTAPTAVQTIALPEPGYPMLTRMITNPLFPSADPTAPKDEPVTWIVSQSHPLVPNLKVVRMFLDRGGVEVYSVSSDGKVGMRNLVPLASVRLVEEFMPIDVFVEELAAAEADDGDEEPDDTEPEPEPVAAAPAPPNGQNAVS